MPDTTTTAAPPPAPPALRQEDLLTDEQVMHFINRGYHLVEPDFAPGFNEATLAALEATTDHGNGVLDAVPALYQVYNHPKVRGALVSLLGPDMRMNEHRHCHVISPGNQSQGWHQDGTNVRHHQTWTVLAMYYPQTVTPDMGPTVILPGTHFRNAPTDRMVNYTNVKGCRFLTVKAGTVAITHYDLWHAGTVNRSQRKRYMLKFLFDRKTAPEKLGKPSWNHDPVGGDKLAQGMVGEMVGPITHYGSDYYKEWELRREMWEWYMGRGKRLPAGAFKDLLS
ncbi:MAG: phytanoyl-CoA dioxygenase family protein [Planctomycetes bacterium]|nr:phytanoyl-CoA dioxygenase family protein [Planctomycetota bacterium]